MDRSWLALVHWKTHYYRLTHLLVIIYLSISLCQCLTQLDESTQCPIGFTYAPSPQPMCYRLTDPEPYRNKYTKCRGNLYTFELAKKYDLHQLGSFKLWTDYQRKYNDGPFVVWSYGEMMGLPLAKSQILDTALASFADRDLNCAVYDNFISSLIPTACNETHRFLCMLKPYGHLVQHANGCPEYYYRLHSPLSTCLHVPSGGFTSSRRAIVRATWTQVMDICHRRNGTLLHEGYIYANHPDILRDQGTELDLPLGIIRKGSELFWAEYDRPSNLIASSDWLLARDSKEQTLVALRGRRWEFVSSTHRFFNLICEHFIELPRLTLRTYINDNDDISLEVSHATVQEESLWCFTDSLNYFPVRTPIIKSRESAKQYIIQPQLAGLYWCLCVDTTNFTSEESNKILYIPDKIAVTNLYAIKVGIRWDPQAVSTHADTLKAVTSRINRILVLQSAHKDIENSQHKNITITNTRWELEPDDTNDMLGSSEVNQTKMVFLSSPTREEFTNVSLKRIYERNQNLLLHGHLKPGIRPLPSGYWGDIEIYFMKLAYYCNDSGVVLSLGESSVLEDGCTYLRCDGEFATGTQLTRWRSGRCMTSFREEIVEDKETKRSDEEAEHDPNIMSNDMEGDDDGSQTVKYSRAWNDNKDRPTDTIQLSTFSPAVAHAKHVQSVLEHLENVTAGTLHVDELDSSAAQVNELFDLDADVEISARFLHALDALGQRLVFEYDQSHVAVVHPNLAILVAEHTTPGSVLGLRLAATGSDTFREGSLELVTDRSAININSTASELFVKIPETVFNDADSRVTFVLFRNARAFNDATHTANSVNSRVLSVTITNFTGFREGDYIDIHVQPFRKNITGNERRACAFWDFSIGKNGGWSQRGCSLIQSKNSSFLDFCRCSHLTHFAEIISLRSGGNGSDPNAEVLTVISYVGCGFSLTGLFVIALTGLLFRSWRSDFANKVWLHLSASITLLICSFLAMAMIDFQGNYGFSCIALGVLVHYSVLSSFCWMLVGAILSYQRLVTVFTKRYAHKLLKACVFSWGFPICIIGTLLIVDPDNYTYGLEENLFVSKFCYPTGIGFWLSVFLPVLVVVSVNTILFSIIIYSVFINTKVKRHGDTGEVVRCITVSFLLIFLFGLPWILGLFARYGIFDYLFTFAATFQGFILFIFFVVGNKKTRDLWLNYLNLDKQTRSPMTSTSYNSSVTKSATCKGVASPPITFGKFDDAMTTKPRSLTGEDDIARFS